MFIITQPCIFPRENKSCADLDTCSSHFACTIMALKCTQSRSLSRTVVDSVDVDQVVCWLKVYKLQWTIGHIEILVPSQHKRRSIALVIPWLHAVAMNARISNVWPSHCSCTLHHSWCIWCRISLLQRTCTSVPTRLSFQWNWSDKCTRELVQQNNEQWVWFGQVVVRKLQWAAISVRQVTLP